MGNAMEGEFLSRKDAALLTGAPGLVLDGLRLVGRALGARRTILAVGPRVDPAPVLAAARPTKVEVQRLRGGFVAGQESALVNALDGRSAVPSDRLDPVWRRGVAGHPTLVVNAETLAQVALVARYGAAWFREAGTDADPGTFLVSVSGSAEQVLAAPAVLEVPRGIPLRAVLDRAGVRLPRARAVLVGGYHGSWLTPESYDVPLSRESLATYGASPGAGVLHVLDRQHCPLRITADIATYLGRESAGQCGPCVNGLPRMAETLTRLADGTTDPGLVTEIARLRALVVARGACHHPDGTARLVASTMRVFDAHVAAHLRGECRGADPR